MSCGAVQELVLVFTRACTGTFFFFWFLGALMTNGNKEIKVEFIQSAYEQGGDLPSGKKNGSLITRGLGTYSLPHYFPFVDF